jgi:hypothetical protein
MLDESEADSVPGAIKGEPASTQVVTAPPKPEVQGPPMRQPGEPGPATPRPETAAEADRLFPAYDPETEERKALADKAVALAKRLRLSPKQREELKAQHLGGKDIYAADLAALADLVAALEAGAA